MQKKIDLVNGPVLSSLTRLAVPIMATSLIQMAYNMTDMIWIGRIGSSAVASVGAAGMYMWLSNGLAALAKMGGQVNVGHALGASNSEEAAEYASNALQLTLTLGIIYGLVCILGAKPLIHFFHLNQAQVIRDAIYYLEITCGLVLFSFLNQTYTGLFTAIGNSRPVFLATTTGLVVNIILDPVLIFGRTISGSSSDRRSNCYGNRADDRYSYVFYICDEGYRTFSICKISEEAGSASSERNCQNRFSNVCSEYAVYRNIDDHCTSGRGIWRCGGGCPESWFTDRINFVDDSGWFCSSGEFIYIAEPWRR